MPHSGASIASAGLHVDARVAGAHEQRVRLGGRQARVERAVDEQAPDLLVRDGADEVLDVHAAVAERAALLVGLGDLGGEGDDAFKAGLHLGGGHGRAPVFSNAKGLRQRIQRGVRARRRPHRLTARTIDTLSGDP